jgi:flagella basal body P-ring formation protein FlgA
MKALLALLPLFLLDAGAQCISVPGRLVLASDLAGAVPAFASLPPDTVLFPSPAPRIRRVMRSGDLDRVARSKGLPGASGEICLERILEAPSGDAVQVAIRRALEAMGSAPSLEIRITDYSRAPTPPGTIELRPANLTRTSEGYHWRGRIRAGPAETAPFWVRFSARAQRAVVILTRAVKQGEPLDEGAVRMEMRNVDLPGPQPLSALHQAIGSVATRGLPEGQPLLPAHIAAALAVQSGSVVQVTVVGNGAVLRLGAKAGQDGRRGDVIALENPLGRRRFRARVTGPGEAELIVNESNSHAN